MPTPKKTDSKKSAAKEAQAPKKKTSGKSASKTVAEVETPAKKKCCRKKSSTPVAEPEKTTRSAKKNTSVAKKTTSSAKETTSSAKKVVSATPAKKKKTEKEPPAKAQATQKKQPVPAAPAPAPVNPVKSELTDEQAEALAAARAELAANPEWEAFVRTQRQHLLNLRDRSLDSMSGVARDTLRNHPDGSESSGSGEHQADAGSNAYDRDFALSMLSKEQDGLYEIEQALARIDNGTYGICEMSYKVIPIPRLEAIPFARLTVECQAQWEKEKGQNAKFRPRVALGFAGGPQNEIDLPVSLDEEEE